MKRLTGGHKYRLCNVYYGTLSVQRGEYPTQWQVEISNLYLSRGKEHIPPAWEYDFQNGICWKIVDILFLEDVLKEALNYLCLCKYGIGFTFYPSPPEIAEKLRNIVADTVLNSEQAQMMNIVSNICGGMELLRVRLSEMAISEIPILDE